MTDSVIIAASPRTVIGKANRRLSSEGLIPAVLYGAGRDSQAISVSRHDFEVIMGRYALGATLVKLELEGESEPVNVIVKAMQNSPVKGNVVHIDFLAIRMDEKLQASIPLHLVGDAEGVKAGGVIMHTMHEILVEALPRDLPSSIDVDITALEVGDNLHVSDITGPEGVEIVDDPGAIVCSVTVPMAEEEEKPEEGAEEIQPEVIGESEGESEED